MFKILSFTFVLMIVFVNPITIQAESKQAGLRAGKLAIDFTLSNTKGDDFRLRDVRGKNLILIIAAEGDSKKSRQKYFKANKKWIEVIRKKYKNRLMVLGMAGLNIFFAFKGFARRKLKKTQPIVFLIDWDGEVYKNYGHKGVSTIVLIDKKGIVRHITIGNYSMKAASALFTTVHTVLNSK